MNELLIGLLSILVATNQAIAASNVVSRTTGVAVKVKQTKTAATNDPVEVEYQKLIESDDAAVAEVEKWVTDERAFTAKGAPFSQAALNLRIEQRLEPVRKAYQDFLQHHTNHTRAYLAYGSFLDALGEEDEAVKNWDLARQIEPTNAAAWNNLANFYGHRGPSKKAFEYYEKAIELNPDEPVYYHNFGTTVFLFRKDAREYYQADEQQVFDRALKLYRKAVELDPKNFALATDVAQTFYGIKPQRTKEALAAWEHALTLAPSDAEREGVYIHFARIKINAGLFDEARTHLGAVTNTAYNDIKARVALNLEQRERKSKETNAPPPTVEKKPEN